MINLVYWSESNYGDALSPLLVEELSGQKTRMKAAYIDKNRRFVKALLYVSTRAFSTILFPWQENVLGVGSIITCGNKRSKIWGSGFMNDSGQCMGGDILAVRGPDTARRLVEQGFPECKVYGDPALLLPIWLKPAKEKKHRLGIVPHWKEASAFIADYGKSHKVIDLRTQDVKKVTNEITSCDFILSTSLHGLIVAHAYNIPALWIRKGYIETDGFKFADYFKSVGIAPYDGFENIDDLLSSEDQWLNLFQNHRDKSVLNCSLEKIQENLLGAAPFPLNRKYRK